MAKYIQNLWKALTKNRISAETSDNPRLQKLYRNIFRQAALTVLTVVLTVVILFAMTSAWYTNVAQTSGLNFEAEAWGFKGDITIENEAIMAAPGDDGIIDLSVENDSDSVSAISVTVSKNAMVEDMRKRLFFYADTRMKRNDEVMDRVYLNRFEGYTYNVFNNSQLMLTEEFSNAPVIKWEWVYDVLGYYVLGQPNTVAKADDPQSTVTKMDIKEYLRPIVYDFDKATTSVNTEGEQIQIEISTVDGELTPAQFLNKLSQKDGYEGTISKNATPVFDNYYAVDVDENGYGVYAYLCSYSDIQIETQYDSDLGELAYKKARGEPLTPEQEAELRHSVTLSLSAQKDDESAVQVGSITALQDAIAAGEANVIQLIENVNITQGETITIPENKRLMLDLNGKTLTNVSGDAIVANPGSSLTVVNGKMVQADQSELDKPTTTYAVRSYGAEVVMSRVDIQNFSYGIYVGDNMNNNPLDSRVHIKETTIDGEVCAVFISGNGLVSEQKTMLIVDNSTLSSCGYAISGNGTVTGNGRWGTDIQIINNSVILGVKDPDSDFIGTGIYQPQKDSTLTVTDSYVEGGNAIVLKGGHVKIHNSTIVGVGEFNEPAFTTSGFTDTGDAVYIETHYEYEMSAVITGDSRLTHKSGDSRSFRVYKETDTNVRVEIAGGVFDEALPDKYLAEGYIQQAGRIKDENNNEVDVMIVKKQPAQTGEATEPTGE